MANGKPLPPSPSTGGSNNRKVTLDGLDLEVREAALPKRASRNHYTSRCPNCDQRFGGAKFNQVYCGFQCKAEADAVRYGRKQLARYPTGDWPEDIAYAVTIRIAHALAGGYNEGARRLPPEVRAAVIERDQGTCQLCGGPGKEIDHVNGPSRALSNLRLLCKRCHEQVTRQHLVPIRDDTTAVRHADILRRIHSELPERHSDDSEAWNAEWRGWLAQHRGRTRRRSLAGAPAASSNGGSGGVGSAVPSRRP